MKKYLSIIILFMIFTSCQKDEIMTYEGDEMISFYRNSTEVDSINYTFAFHPVPKEKDTVFVKMRVQGTKQPRTRVVKLKVANGTTAVLGEDFILSDMQLPAEALTLSYPIVLLNSTKLKTNSLKIVLEVADSEDFVAGGVGREIGGTYALSTYKIWFSDRAEKPAYWDRIVNYFGNFSARKLRFMIQTLGITDFSSTAIGNYGLNTYPVTLQNALEKYVAENGPMIDEFGEEVTF